MLTRPALVIAFTTIDSSPGASESKRTYTTELAGMVLETIRGAFVEKILKSTCAELKPLFTTEIVPLLDTEPVPPINQSSPSDIEQLTAAIQPLFPLRIDVEVTELPSTSNAFLLAKLVDPIFVILFLLLGIEVPIIFAFGRRSTFDPSTFMPGQTVAG